MKPTGERVLVIDDDAVALELLTATIRAAGFEVIPRRLPPPLQEVKRLGLAAVVCDLVMEGQDGDRVLSTFQSQPELRDVAFVLVSADSERLDSALARMPWLHCVRKDGGLAGVVSTLDKLIERRSGLGNTGKFRFGEPGTGKVRFGEPSTGTMKLPDPGEPPSGSHRFGEPSTASQRLPPEPPSGSHRFPDGPAGAHSRPAAVQARDRVRQRFFDQLRETTRALRPYLIGGVLGPRAHEEVQRRFKHLRNEAAVATMGTVVTEALSLCERLTERAQRDLRAMELLGACTAWFASLDPNQPLPIALDGVRPLCDARALLDVR
jgi:CheY-like chemotaxis protein